MQDEFFGLSQNDHGLDFESMTIRLKGQEMSVIQALKDGLLHHDEQTGLMRLGRFYTPHSEKR